MVEQALNRQISVPERGRGTAIPVDHLNRSANAELSSRVRTYLWAVIYVLQEISLPNLGTGDNSIRTLAPFGIFANRLILATASLAVVVIFSMHGFNMQANLLISVVTLLMPFILLSAERTRIAPLEFSSVAIAMIFSACAIQALFPGPANTLFSPFLDGYMTYDGIFSRATAFSMEPSFAAEALFAVAMIYLFFARTILTRTVFFLLGAVLLIRAATTLQQVFIVAAIYIWLKLLNLVLGKPDHANSTSFAQFASASLFAVCLMLFGYSYVIYGEWNLSFISDSLEKYGSWRALSNYAAAAGSDLIAFFPHHATSGWANAISEGLHSAGLEGDGWIVQPFGMIGVAVLDLGLLGTIAWIALLFHLVHKRINHYSLYTYQISIIYALLLNTIVFAPKWQLSGFLAIGLIAAGLKTNKDTGSPT